MAVPLAYRFDHNHDNDNDNQFSSASVASDFGQLKQSNRSPSKNRFRLSIIEGKDKNTQDTLAKLLSDEKLHNDEQPLKFEIAYPVLADRRGINATPAGRAASRKVWRDTGADAAKWLIHKLQTEQHPDMIIGIAETITDLGAVALPAILGELEGCAPKPEYAALVEALSWMDPPQNSSLLVRINSIADRYLASSDRDCQIAAVQLTRILDDRRARLLLDKAQGTAGQRLREEIEDLLSERFEE